MENKFENITKAIPARKKMEFMRNCRTMESKKAVFDLAKETAEQYQQKNNWTKEQTKKVALNLYACGFCVWQMEHAENVFDFMCSYIAWKQRTFEKLNDLGAFGDSIETIVHLVACRKIWRTSKNVLHVSAIGKTDVKINGIRFEVGHNGKTWADSELDEPMKGNFDGVIYGVFDEETTEKIISLFRCGQYMKAIKAVCSRLYVFPDKNDHLDFMQNISRSESIQYKKHLARYMTIYNPSKHYAFLRSIEKSGFPSLLDYMNNLGENDYTNE